MRVRAQHSIHFALRHWLRAMRGHTLFLIILIFIIFKINKNGHWMAGGVLVSLLAIISWVI